MADEQLTYDDLLRIVELIKSSEQFSEFRLKVGEIEIELRRRNAAGAPMPSRASAVAPSAAPTVVATEPMPEEKATLPTWPESAYVIRSPMVGTFYRAPEPGAAPFVEVGQQVDTGTIVCIVEVMKLMNSVAANVRGTVLHVLVGDAAPVQAGQPLIVVQPEAGSQ
ncbi:MAG TPA: acetyl-CoA carboxylase biotin carboxyl carrier protein [Burkholderiaceae bacterium]|nr:acetyl-CoA carboxylase biotin carboxyl carrier protein [Burkholderiaceae bacterium]